MTTDLREAARRAADELRRVLDAVEGEPEAATAGQVVALERAVRACSKIADRPEGQPAQVRRGREPGVSTEAKRAILAYADEGMSPRAIAERLSAEGVATARGGRWQHTTVRGVLNRFRT